MEAKSDFFEALSALVEYATVNGNTVKKQDVENHFKDIIEDSSKYDAVYAYLLENNIKISDYEGNIKVESPLDNSKDDNTDNKSVIDFSPIKPAIESDEEKMFVEMYLDEVKDLNKITDEEIDKLVTVLENDNIMNELF